MQLLDARQRPIELPALVRWYQCGPTVYDDAHLGHARCYMAFDVIRRVLEARHGCTVVTAMNITDIDDKIIAKATADNSSTADVARRYEARFMEDMDRLGVRRPDAVLRVTEHMQDIVTFVQDLVDKGMACVRGGSVYFDGDAYKAAGYAADWFGRGLDRADFALWKAAADDAMVSWPSPWGPGRAGWHSECVVLSRLVFGETFEVHSGGADLLLHHNNEACQACAAFGKEAWGCAFVHAGHLHIDGCKMSKSLKNFQTVRSFLDAHGPDCLRMLFLTHRWDEPFDYNSACVREAEATLQTLTVFVQSVQAGAVQTLAPPGLALLQELARTRRAVGEALDDGVDTVTAVRGLLKIVSVANRHCATHGSDLAVNKVREYVQSQLELLGFQRCDTGSTTAGLLDAVVDYRKHLRARAKASKDPVLFELADDLRSRLAGVGVQLEDRR